MQPVLEVLTALDAAGVKYVIVGGVAVVLQGHPRMTVDLDLVLDLDVENARLAVETLTTLGMRPRLPVDAASFYDAKTRESWVLERNLIAFTMYHPRNPLIEVDLIASSPLDYEQLRADADVMELAGLKVPVASRAHLIELKRVSSRRQDLADIEVLERLQGLANEASGDTMEPGRKARTPPGETL